MIKITKVERQAELEQCLNVRREVFIAEKGVPEYIEVDGHDILGGKCDHFLILKDDTAVGTFRCMRLDGDTVKLQRLCVRKVFRGIGVGRYALRFIEKYYSECGVKCIEFDAKFEACEFYKKNGYSIVSDKFYEANVLHVKMSKVIN